MSLHVLFESLATRTWDRIRDGYGLAVPQGEVSMTDDLLLELARARHPGLVILKTPIDREPNQGTDWEWMIGSPAIGWLRYAVQAKRVDFPSGRYSALGHTVAGKRQVDTLLSYAYANDSIPLYCFYNYSTMSPLDPYWHCHLPLDPTQLGCTVAPAEIVKAKIVKRGERTFKSVHTEVETRPWRCLVRCPEILSAYSAGLGNRVLFPLLRDKGTVLIHPTLPPGMQDTLGGATNHAVIGAMSEEDFDSTFFRGERTELPRYVVVINLGISPSNVPTGQSPLLLPETRDIDVSRMARSKAPQALKKIRRE